jgi:FkbM family methyltransferase
MKRVNIRDARIRLVVVRLTAPMRRRDMTIWLGANAGRRINATHSQLGAMLGTTEPELQRRFTTLLEPGQVLFDVGANIGFFSMLGASLVGPDGRVYAFDPVPHHADAIRHNLGLNDIRNFTLIEKAVADHSGRARLLVPPESTGARVDSQDPAPGEGHIEVEEIDVDLVTLDELVESNVIRPPDVVKIDVEGAEVEVVKGMSRTLARYRPVLLCEMHGRNGEYAKLVASMGFDVYTLDGGDVERAPPYAVYTEARPRE